MPNHLAGRRNTASKTAKSTRKPNVSSRREIPRVIVILADEHHPDVDPHYERAKLALLADLQPAEIIWAGDAGEWTCGSQHVPDAFRAAYEDDVRALRDAFRRVRRVCPRSQLTFLEGNHENALLRTLSSKVPSMVKGFWERFAADLDLDKLEIEWVPEMQQPIRRGNLRVLHGHQIPGRQLPKHHAAKVADLYGAPGLTVVFGHSHRPGMYLRPSREGNCRAYALGAGRELSPDWTKGAPMGWSNELGIAVVQASGAVSFYPVPLVDGALAWGGKLYVGNAAVTLPTER